MTVKPVPFTLRIPDADITDLRDRLARTRFPDSAPGDAWAYGTDVGYLRQLTEYWRDTFDWRAEEAALNAFPQFRVPLEGIDLLYLHVPGVGPDTPADRNYEGGFAAALMLKDLKLAMEAAQAAGAYTPMGGEAEELYERFVNRGGGSKDFSALIKMIDDSWVAPGGDAKP